MKQFLNYIFSTLIFIQIIHRSKFKQTYQLKYEAQYTDTPKVSVDSAIERWKSANPDKKLDMDHYDNITLEWIQKHMVVKFLTIFSSPRLLIDRQQCQMKETVKKTHGKNLQKHARQRGFSLYQIQSQNPLAPS